MPKRCKPPRVVLDSISGRVTTPEYDQMDQSVAKIDCHSASRRKAPLLRDRQNASSEVVTSRPTSAARHTSWAKEQAKNKCWQSSTALAHSGHSTGESGNMRCRKDLVINRRCSRSQAKILIFKGRRRFHTNRHLCKKIGSSDAPSSRSNL